jgi:hypothetical protein
MNIIARTVAILAVPLALAGCRSGYDVDVRNMTDQPVVASLVKPFGDGVDRPLAQTRLGPGDRGQLFSQQESREMVSLSVDFAGNVGHPAKLDLSRGKTVVNVRKTEAGAKGRLTLEEVPRP